MQDSVTTMNYQRLNVGTCINIRRTDGRVHSAFIASVDHELKTATVEWFEQNETKGKEIDLAVIKMLNPEVQISPIENSQIQDQLTQITSTQNTKNAASTITEDVAPQMNALRRDDGPSEEAGGDSDDDINSNQLSSGTATLPTSTVQSMSSSGRPMNGSMKSTRLATTKLSHSHVSNNGHATTSETLPKETFSAIPTAQNPRKSNVVKEVEKLKKNREERRQRQAEEKAEKEAFLQMAPGNPHWELQNMILEYRRGLDMKPLTGHDEIEDHLITVCVRKRPINNKEARRKEVDVITIPSKDQLIVHEPKNKVDLTKYLDNQLFKFDYAFDVKCNNEVVYKYTAQPLIKTVFDGGFATCFAYGQTGSGKTHTMGGDFNGKNQDCHKGIYAMATDDVFKLVKSPQFRHLGLIVSVSFFEIYSGKVFDLLANKAKLRVLEDGKQQVQVVGLVEKVVISKDEVLKLIQKGNQARTSGQTSANSNSSRSHAIFQIILRQSVDATKVHGKFSLIDLAGNERGADTSSADRQTRMEGAEINKSLLALKECIRALGRKGAHLPFRVSKLTQVLRDSFVGPNSKTCMIAMISPGVASCEHSLNTLRYADRVKELGGGVLELNMGDDYANDRQNDGDLSHLRSLNENDMTPEMLDFHQVISDLQIAEDTMLDNHKKTCHQVMASMEKVEQLWRMTNNVTYDQEDYCKRIRDVVNNSMLLLAKTIEVTDDYCAKLAAEEKLSRTAK